MTQTTNLNTANGQTVIGVFDEVSAAERAINDLKFAGFTPNSVSIITRDRNAATTELAEDTGSTEAGKGAVSGALGGGTLGAVLGWLLAGGAAVVIPGVGPVIAAGVLGATVTGALVGGSLGSIAAALAGAGIPEEQAQEYEEHVRGGRTIVSAIAPNGQMVQSARDVFERNGASTVRSYVDNDNNNDNFPNTPNATADVPYASNPAPMPTVATPPTPMPGGTDYPTATTTDTGAGVYNPANDVPAGQGLTDQGYPGRGYNNGPDNGLRQ